jgi:predicted transcriptional regulator
MGSADLARAPITPVRNNGLYSPCEGYMEPKAGTFSAYLEYAQRGAHETALRPSPLASLLGLLAKMPQGGVPMSKLADLSGMSAARFRDAIKKLADSNFIEVSGQPLSEVVAITDKGRDAAALL